MKKKLKKVQFESLIKNQATKINKNTIFPIEKSRLIYLYHPHFVFF